MEAKLKRCKQCGEIKSETLYREYYGRGENKGTRTGKRYKTCIPCESVNNRYKYLNKKDNKTADQIREVEMIEELYEAQRSLGLRPPASATKNTEGVMDSVELMLAKYRGMKPEKKETLVSSAAVPPELEEWLNKQLVGEPDDLQEAFDIVEAKYRPQIGLNDNLEPEFDNTYKKTLNEIQNRLDDYEDNFYE